MLIFCHLALVVLFDLHTLLVILGKHGVGKGIQWKRTFPMGINDTFLKGDGTRNAVNGGYQQIAVQLWMTDTGIQPLLGIRTVSDFLCRWCLTQNLLGGLVQQIGTTETYQEHLQERVADEHLSCL